MLNKRKKLIERILLVLVLSGLFVPSTVAAYIEPGMVTILWQILLAGFIGFMVFVRQTRLWFFSLIQWLRRGRGFLRDNSKDKINEDGSSGEPD